MYCECDESKKLRFYCRRITSDARALLTILSDQNPNEDVSRVEHEARQLASRGVKINMRNLIASGIHASVFQDVTVKKKLLDLKHKYNAVPKLTKQHKELSTDVSGYLLTGIDM